MRKLEIQQNSQGNKYGFQQKATCLKRLTSDIISEKAKIVIKIKESLLSSPKQSIDFYFASITCTTSSKLRCKTWNKQNLTTHGISINKDESIQLQRET